MGPELREWLGFAFILLLAVLGAGRWIGRRERADTHGARASAARVAAHQREHEVLQQFIEERFARIDTDLARLQSPKWLDSLQAQMVGFRDEWRREIDTMSARVSRIERKVFNGPAS